MKDYKRGLTDEQFEKVLKDCIDKVEGITDKDWQEIVEENDLGIHRDVLRKGFQSPVGGYPVYRFLQERNEQSKDEILNEIERKRIELEKEKIKLQDQRRDYRAFIRQEARWEELRRMILEGTEVIKANPEQLYNKPINMKSDKDGIACALISDLHYGLEIDTYFNRFDKKVANERLGYYINQIIKICVEDNIKVLNLELLGDLISGLIHIETRIYNQEDVISQTLECAELLAQGIAKIADNFYYKDLDINIYFAVGNHSRVNANYKEHIDEENFEYIMKWVLQHKLKEYPKVHFIDNEKNPDICELDVFGRKIVATHGHYDKPQSALNTLTKYLHYEVDEVHMGHLHNYQFINGVLINGCLSGSDQYAQRKRFSNEPCQIVKVYYEDGNTITHEIKV